MKIGLLSDTHGYLDERVFAHFKECDQIWHAGDIGTLDVIEQLAAFKPVQAVYGNVDGSEIRGIWPKDARFTCEGLQVWITHIGGYPPRYNPQVLKEIKENTPDIFVCGHSHILRVMADPARKGLLHLNPGAAGKHGFHHMRTLLRFDIVDRKITNMEVIELGKRGEIV